MSELVARTQAGGGATPWHQDQYYWPLSTDQTITMWMPLVDVPSSVGTMTFASGSHRLGFLGSYAISDESEAAILGDAMNIIDTRTTITP